MKVSSRIGHARLTCSHLMEALNRRGATTHFFDVQEVFGIEIDCSSLDGAVLVQSSTVAHIRLHCKRYWFGLEGRSTAEII